MHIFFSGIGGGAIGPLALIARQAGYTVSGSDKQQSAYTDSLQEQGIALHIGQSEAQIAAVHKKQPIDWLVYSSAITKEQAEPPELTFAKAQGIKITKRDELLNEIIRSHALKLIAIAGTHGKSTTTAMVIWLFQSLGIPLSYSVGAKIPFGPMGQFVTESEYFVYECDEFDRNFLAFHPFVSLITGIGWDHHEIFPTQESYMQAFREFINQSKQTFLWDDDTPKLQLVGSDRIAVLQSQDSRLHNITLHGIENRQNALQAVEAVHAITGAPIDILLENINTFPGLKQRMEQLAPYLFANYAHTPEKIRGGMHTALEIADATQKQLVVIYEPLTNRRQHFIAKDYKNCFEGAAKLYWVPTYLAREDPEQKILTPAELITYLDNAKIAEPAELNNTFLRTIREHLQQGDIVVAMGASGSGSLDAWLREHLQEITR